ncbi:hypothetical protein [Pantoea agglomerans]|uniref:hypothetical protein n=1 Tax=Enterobacter agglomerans TaxID=549 RepID=UPI003C7C95D8
MAGQLHIKWMSESLAASPAGGAFLLAYPLKGMSKRLSLVGDRKITLLPTGKAVTAIASGFPFKEVVKERPFFVFAHANQSPHTLLTPWRCAIFF